MLLLWIVGGVAVLVGVAAGAVWIAAYACTTDAALLRAYLSGVREGRRLGQADARDAQAIGNVIDP